MDFKQKMALSAKINELTKAAKDESTPLFDRMKLMRERIDVFRELKQAVNQGKQTREQIGEHIPNATVERKTANEITITRETRYQPVVINVEIDREKSQITVRPPLADERMFDYHESSFTSAVQSANEYIVTKLATAELAYNSYGDEKAEREKRQEESKHDWRVNELSDYQSQRERVVKALEAFSQIKAREDQGKEPTNAQREVMRGAILELPTSKAYLDNDSGLFRAGEQVLPKRLESLNEIVAEIEAEIAEMIKPSETEEPEIIKQYKAGELVSLNAERFKVAMTQVNSLGLDLDEIKRGAAAWFEFNEVA